MDKAKRMYVAVPASIAGEFESLAKELGQNPSKFGVHCLEGCLAAIKSETAIAVPIVQHARRVLRKDSAVADRLLMDLLEKTFPELPKNPARFKELLVDETNKISGTLTKEKLQGAHAIAMARWKAEGKSSR